MTSQASASASSTTPRAYKILVAVAFDPTADSALIEALSLAARTPNSETHIVHAAVDSASGSAAPPATVRQLDHVREQLDERVEAAWKQVGEITVIAHVRPGEPAEVIVQAAIDIDADLIVVGSHRRTGLRKLALGSVAERVLHTAHCPVLVAVTKDYSGTTASPSIAPACTDCLDTRKRSANARFWCERHSKPYLQPHIYVPRDAVRSSIPPMY